MKTFILKFVILGAILFMGFQKNQQQNIAVNFGVRGNCGMCKRTIEKAAKSVKGVSKANWNRKKKKIYLVVDKKTKILKIHQAIAKSGYDTDKIIAQKKDYEKLFSCCKYDRKMNLKTKKSK